MAKASGLGRIIGKNGCQGLKEIKIMSVDYYANICIGFCISLKELSPFYAGRAEVSHLEDRFDIKTGKKCGETKVVDTDEGIDYKIGGHVFEGPTTKEMNAGYLRVPDDMIDFLAEKLDCRVTPDDDFEYSSNGQVLCFEPNGIKPTIASILKHQKEFTRIRKAAKKLGLDLGEPEVTAILGIS